jgi:SAM-dependent methyltransferase
VRLAAIPQSLSESLALCAGMVPTPLMDTLVALLLAKTVIAATSLDVFGALADGPLTAKEVAEKCNCDSKAMEKLLSALFASRYLDYRESQFELATVSRRWFSKRERRSVHSAILHRNLDLRFMDFESYVRGGKLKDFHSCLSAEDWRIYHEGQADQAAQIVDEVIERIPLPPHAVDLLDLGGGHGLFSIAFCRRYPALRAKVVDLDTATGQLRVRSGNDVCPNRVQFEVGDLRGMDFRSGSCDVILIANVLHHFDESTNRALLQQVARALRPDGMLLVIEVVRPSFPGEAGQVEALLDLYFGAASGVGLWTIEHIQSWCRNAGFSILPPKGLRKMPSCKMMVSRKRA